MKNLSKVHETVHTKAMETTKDSIKTWLAKYPERDRNWLADQCEVEKRTVDNWLSSPQNIPSKAILIIESLMRLDAETEPSAPLEAVNLPATCSPEQFGLYTRAYRHSECEHFADWITTRLDSAAESELGRVPLHSLKVADVMGNGLSHTFPATGAQKVKYPHARRKKG